MGMDTHMAGMARKKLVRAINEFRAHVPLGAYVLAASISVLVMAFTVTWMPTLFVGSHEVPPRASHEHSPPPGCPPA